MVDPSPAGDLRRSVDLPCLAWFDWLARPVKTTNDITVLLINPSLSVRDWLYHTIDTTTIVHGALLRMEVSTLDL